MRSESMARMPKGARPKSLPASISASKMAFWYSMPWWISKPSSPTKFKRNSFAGAKPTVASRPASQGKDELASGVSHTRSSNVRDLGPANTKTPIAAVRFSKYTEPSMGILRRSQSWSRRWKAPAETR